MSISSDPAGLIWLAVFSAILVAGIYVGRRVRERHATDRALRSSERRFRIAAACAGALVYEWDMSTDRLEWFGNIDGALGLETGAAPRTATAWLDYLHPADQPRLAEALRHAREHAGSLEVQHRVRHRDGRWLFWITRAEARTDHSGRPRKMIGVCSDITTRRDRQQRDRRLKRVFEAAADAMILTDREGRIIEVNPAFTRITGYSANDAIGNTPRILKSGQQPDAFYANLWATISLGREWSGRIVNRRKNGTTYHAVLTISPVLDEQSQLIGYVGIHRDVSAEIEQEEQLRESNALMVETLEQEKRASVRLERTLEELEAANEFQRKTLEVAATAIFTVDRDMHITGVNRAFEDITGFSRDEVIGKHCHTLRGRPCMERCGLYQTDREDRMFQAQCEVTTKSGRRLTILKNADVLRNGSGEIVGGIESFVDITDLMTARERAEAANQAKSEFLANMSHEIRTPMTAILGFSETLLDRSLAEADRLDAVHTIRRNGKYLLQLINDILDLSKIEAGKLEVEQIKCSPIRVVAEAVSLMQVRADAKGLPLFVEYDGAVPESIRSDPTRLRQILINLIGNAIKFTEKGSVRIVTRLVDEDNGRPVMQFDVIDSGIGMSEQQLGRLFQPFTQADSSTTRTFGGTGLGLTISKRLAKMLGGDISVHSEPGAGSTFRVAVATGPLAGVPLVHDAHLTASAQTPPSARGSASSQTDLNCRVLLAEDGPDNQRLISFFLKKAGAKVRIVDNGELAVEAAMKSQRDGRPFDVILMDMQMPVMDGYDATRTLRGRGYDGPIIALTANAMEGDREKCLQAGCNDFATKPIDRQVFLSTVRRYARDDHAANPGRSDSSGLPSA